MKPSVFVPSWRRFTGGSRSEELIFLILLEKMNSTLAVLWPAASPGSSHSVLAVFVTEISERMWQFMTEIIVSVRRGWSIKEEAMCVVFMFSRCDKSEKASASDNNLLFHRKWPFCTAKSGRFCFKSNYLLSKLCSFNPSGNALSVFHFGEKCF